MTKSTKIVATIGPATDSPEKIIALIEAGMDVARFNTKHGDVAWHLERIQRVRQIATQLNRPIGILLDLQGPEIRLTIPGGEAFLVKNEENITFSADPHSIDPRQPILPQIVIESLKPGDHILIDDGLGEFAVMNNSHDEMVATALGDFKVANRKTLNTPNTVINLPSLIDQDLKYLDDVSNQLVDFVGLSFVRNKQDIEILRTELNKRQLTAAIVAKIENRSALDHLEEIILASDAVMVARGDLAVEIPFEELAFWQKNIIKKSRELGKPVITATQMLKSMMENPRPTRAEVSDVANAIYDATDAVMLSEETTIGKYPIEAVKTQSKIASFNEPHACFQPIVNKLDSTSAYVTQAAISMIDSMRGANDQSKIDKVICLTETGNTVRLLSRFRPNLPIFALTSNEQTYKQLSLVYGVSPFLISLPAEYRLMSSQELIDQISKLGIAQKSERILLIHGTFWKKPGLTNTISLITME